MEAVVAEAVSGEPVHGGGGDGAAEGGGRAEADVVGEDEEDVRGAFGSGDGRGEVLGGVLGDAADFAAEGWFGVREDGLGGGGADEEGHADEPEGRVWVFHGMDVRSAGDEVGHSMEAAEIQREGDAKWRMARYGEPPPGYDKKCGMGGWYGVSI